MGVGALEAERSAQQAVVHARRHPADERPLVDSRPCAALLPTTMSASPSPRSSSAPVVEVQVAEVDLVAEHELAPGLEDALLQRRAVVGRRREWNQRSRGFAAVSPSRSAGVPSREPFSAKHAPRSPAGAHRARRAARPAAEGKMRLLVVDRDDDGQPSGQASRALDLLRGRAPTEQRVLHRRVLPLP